MNSLNINIYPELSFKYNIEHDIKALLCKYKGVICSNFEELNVAIQITGLIYLHLLPIPSLANPQLPNIEEGDSICVHFECEEGVKLSFINIKDKECDLLTFNDFKKITDEVFDKYINKYGK